MSSGPALPRRLPSPVPEQRGWIKLGAIAVVALVVATAGYLTIAALQKPLDLTQSFDAPVESLDGQPIDGVVWSVAGGSYSGSGDGLTAQVDRSPTPAVAVFDVGEPLAEVSATLVEPSDGAGIVFRYRDAENYWSFITAPDYGTWVLLERTDGVSRYVGGTQGLDLDPVRDVITLSFDGPSITIEINGRLRQQLVTADLADATGVGFIASEEGTTRWQQISVQGR